MISEMVFGGAAVGGQYGPVGERDVADCLHAAAEAGMNLIDTSAFYGFGKSEEIFGNVLTPDLRKQFRICTKAGRLTRTDFDFSAKGMRECLEGSLKRLRTDHVDILLAHDIEFSNDFDQIFGETTDVLHQLKAEGKCRFIGMSGLPLALLKQVVERCRVDVLISYCHYTLFDQTLVTDLLPVCEQHGVGVMNASPLSMGLLTNSGPPPWHPAGDEIKRVCRETAAACADKGIDLSELGMRFSMNEPRIPATITGTAKRDELERNLKSVGKVPDPDALAFVQEMLKPIHNQTWPCGNFR